MGGGKKRRENLNDPLYRFLLEKKKKRNQRVKLEEPGGGPKSYGKRETEGGHPRIQLARVVTMERRVHEGCALVSRVMGCPRGRRKDTQFVRKRWEAKRR